MSSSATNPRTAIAVSAQVLGQDWVSPAARDAIQKAAADAHELAQHLDAAIVRDAGTAASVTELLTMTATTRRSLDDARLSITAPLKARAKQIEDAVRPLGQALDDLLALGKRKVIAWQQAEAEKVRCAREQREREEVEARRQAAAAAAAGAPPPTPPAPFPPPPPIVDAPRGVRTDYGTASVVRRWDFEIVDFSKLPGMFLLPNERAIRASVNAGVREIPGVRIFQRDDLAVRAK